VLTTIVIPIVSYVGILLWIASHEFNFVWAIVVTVWLAIGLATAISVVVYHGKGTKVMIFGKFDIHLLPGPTTAGTTPDSTELMCTMLRNSLRFARDKQKDLYVYDKGCISL